MASPIIFDTCALNHISRLFLRFPSNQKETFGRYTAKASKSAGDGFINSRILPQTAEFLENLVTKNDSGVTSEYYRVGKEIKFSDYEPALSGLFLLEALTSLNLKVVIPKTVLLELTGFLIVQNQTTLLDDTILEKNSKEGGFFGELQNREFLLPLIDGKKISYDPVLHSSVSDLFVELIFNIHNNNIEFQIDKNKYHNLEQEFLDNAQNLFNEFINIENPGNSFSFRKNIIPKLVKQTELNLDFGERGIFDQMLFYDSQNNKESKRGNIFVITDDIQFQKQLSGILSKKTLSDNTSVKTLNSYEFILGVVNSGLSEKVGLRINPDHYLRQLAEHHACEKMDLSDLHDDAKFSVALEREVEGFMKKRRDSLAENRNPYLLIRKFTDFISQRMAHSELFNSSRGIV